MAWTNYILATEKWDAESLPAVSKNYSESGLEGWPGSKGRSCFGKAREWRLQTLDWGLSKIKGVIWKALEKEVTVPGTLGTDVLGSAGLPADLLESCSRDGRYGAGTYPVRSDGSRLNYHSPQSLG